MKMDVEQIARACLKDHHVDVIEKQKEAIVELRKYVRQMEELTSDISLPHLAVQQIIKLKKEKEELAEKLKSTIAQMQLDTLYLTDDERFIQTQALQREVESTNKILQDERASHALVEDALQSCEAMYSKCMRAVNAEFGLEWNLGCKSSELVAEDSKREKLMSERCEALQELLGKIKTFKSQLRRKEDLLAKYSEEVKKLRQLENEKKTRDQYVHKLEVELQTVRQESTRLRESLAVSRELCAREERGKKRVFAMDFKRGDDTKGKAGGNSTVVKDGK